MISKDSIKTLTKVMRTEAKEVKAEGAIVLRSVVEKPRW
jgi:hypothetical protein